MKANTAALTIRELRTGLTDAVARARYGKERVQITQDGKLAAALIGPEDFELLEHLEMIRDVADYRAAKLEDDGSSITLAELRTKL